VGGDKQTNKGDVKNTQAKGERDREGEGEEGATTSEVHQQSSAIPPWVRERKRGRRSENRKKRGAQPPS
jgi:hypothetical protein